MNLHDLCLPAALQQRQRLTHWATGSWVQVKGFVCCAFQIQWCRHLIAFKEAGCLKPRSFCHALHCFPARHTRRSARFTENSQKANPQPRQKVRRIGKICNWCPREQAITPTRYLQNLRHRTGAGKSLRRMGLQQGASWRLRCAKHAQCHSKADVEWSFLMNFEEIHPRSSSREVRIRIPTCFLDVYLSRGTLGDLVICPALTFLCLPLPNDLGVDSWARSATDLLASKLESTTSLVCCTSSLAKGVGNKRLTFWYLY